MRLLIQFVLIFIITLPFSSKGEPLNDYIQCSLYGNISGFASQSLNDVNLFNTLKKRFDHEGGFPPNIGTLIFDNVKKANGVISNDTFRVFLARVCKDDIGLNILGSTIDYSKLKVCDSKATESKADCVEKNWPLAETQEAKTCRQFRSSDSYVNPIWREPPKYPAVAVKERIEGCVKLSYSVNELGNVRDINIVGSSHRIFEGSAKAALKRWRFNPFIQNGKGYYQKGLTVTFDFNLGD